MERLKKLLEDYKQNMNRQQELDASLLINQGKSQWVTSLKNRADQMYLMYDDNREILRQLDDILSEELSPEKADALYLEASDMYWDDYDDCQILLPILYKLINYYETNENIDKLIFLYSAAYYEESEILNRRIGTKKTSVDYNLKILSYCDRYCQLEDKQTRNRIWAAYYNLIVVGFGNHIIDIQTSYEYLLQALQLWESPEIQSLDGSDERFQRIISRIRSEWLIVEEYIESASDEVQKYFCQQADSLFEQNRSAVANLRDVDSEIYSAYLHSQALQHHMTYDDVLESYLAYCNEKMPICLSKEDLSDEDTYFIINAPLTFVRWLDYDISQETTDKILDVVEKMTQDDWYKKLDRYSTPFVNEIMSEWCFNFLKHLNAQTEKEEWLFRLLIRRQLPTYLHAVMVAHLAEEFYQHAIAVRPELFDGLPEFIDTKSSKFVRQCALLHDIGKTKITDIVNTQIRCLCDKEFQGIRKHPEYGADMISNDFDLSIYHDVILGHHKFYDGKGGYPDHFDNTASPYRIIIDLITLCDCIDAASDSFGRSYKASKTLDDLLIEFEAEKGTRYNPDLVDILKNSAKLQDRISYIISDGRIDIMYDAYKNSFF